MRALLVLAAALLFPQEKNEAEELFKRMEEKLAKAKTVQLKSSGLTSEGRHVGKLTVEVELLVGGENRIRVDTVVKTDPPLGDMKMQALSDGSWLKTKSDVGDYSIETPKTLATDLVRAFSRGGALFGTGWLQATAANDPGHPDRRKIPEVAGFKLGKKEKVDGREAQAIEYKLKGLEAGEIACTLWIDCESGLPVKRDTGSGSGPKEMGIVESYSGLKLDEKIDPAKFELSKDK
jgi:outer membrane lipoprotein-sorting protein